MIIPSFILILLLIIFFKCKKAKSKKFNKIEEDITVITLNYKRPHNIIKQINTILPYENIKQIIICHASIDVYSNVIQKIPNVSCIEHKFHDNSLGGAIRFEIAQKYAKYDKLLFIDDDMVPTESFVNNLGQYCKECPVLLGTITRKCNVNGYSKMIETINDVLKLDINYDIVLTQIMMTNRYTLNKVFDEFKQYYRLFKETRGNGEDIIFNLCFIKIFNIKPTKLRGDYKTLDTVTESYSSKSNHFETRDLLCTAFS